MASRDSLSMLVTLELRERVNELSLASGRQRRSGKNGRREPNAAPFVPFAVNDS